VEIGNYEKMFMKLIQSFKSIALDLIWNMQKAQDFDSTQFASSDNVTHSFKKHILSK